MIGLFGTEHLLYEHTEWDDPHHETHLTLFTCDNEDTPPQRVLCINITDPQVGECTVCIPAEESRRIVAALLRERVRART